jgi:hypothetical protein
MQKPTPETPVLTILPNTLRIQVLVYISRQSQQAQMALQQADYDQLCIKIEKELSQTRYSCLSLSPLSGGSANFLFRGTLSQPLEDGSQTVIIKHSKEFVSVNRNFHLDVSRCVSCLFLFSLLYILTISVNKIV